MIKRFTPGGRPLPTFGTGSPEAFMRILIAILLVILVLLQAKLWLGEGGYRDVQRLSERVAEQDNEYQYDYLNSM